MIKLNNELKKQLILLFYLIYWNILNGKIAFKKEEIFTFHLLQNGYYL